MFSTYLMIHDDFNTYIFLLYRNILVINPIYPSIERCYTANPFSVSVAFYYNNFIRKSRLEELKIKLTTTELFVGWQSADYNCLQPLYSTVIKKIDQRSFHNLVFLTLFYTRTNFGHFLFGNFHKILILVP